VGTNLSGDQPAYNAKKRDLLLERIATAPLLILDRMEGSRSLFMVTSLGKLEEVEKRDGLTYATIRRATRLLYI
jgi:hypothetical protein